MTKYTRVSVWKHECSPSKNGCRSRAAAKNTRFSERVLYSHDQQPILPKNDQNCAPLHLIVVDDEFLLQHLDSVQPVRLLLLRQHDFTEVALSEHGEEVEVVEADFASTGFLGDAPLVLTFGVLMEAFHS